METRDTAWHSRRELIVPILVGIIVGVLPAVLPMNWVGMLICSLILAICIIWLIRILVSSKRLRNVILVGATVLLILGVFYRVREQWIKDYTAPTRETSHPVVEQPRQHVPPVETKEQKRQSTLSKKAPQAEEAIPELKLFLFQEPVNYAPNLEVDGVKWHRDYRQYMLAVSNQSSKIELFDLRISLEFPWVIVKHSIETSEGTQEVKLSQQRTIGGITNTKDNITVDTFEYYINNLEVDAVRLFPKGKFSIQLFLMKIPTEETSTGRVTLKFRYLDNGGNRIGKVSVFPVEFKNKTDHENMFIDTDHPITGNYKGYFIMRFKKPLLFNRNGITQGE